MSHRGELTRYLAKARYGIFQILGPKWPKVGLRVPKSGFTCRKATFGMLWGRSGHFWPKYGLYLARLSKVERSERDRTIVVWPSTCLAHQFWAWKLWFQKLKFANKQGKFVILYKFLPRNCWLSKNGSVESGTSISVETAGSQKIPW